MTKFIEVTPANGTPKLLNIDFIEFIETAKNNPSCSYIYCSGKGIEVLQPYATLRSQLVAALER